MARMKEYIFLAFVVCLVNCDVYFHNMRGSNNRLDESGREVANNKRLFNSQNNNRGGYLVGNMYYYEQTDLQIEWTNQHSCNNENNNCELIVQYMCADNVRDGAIRTTIREHARQCIGMNCNTDTRFGMHEEHLNYLKCRTRRRNKGLFTADQQLRGGDARFTRQNPKGTRYGYECPEERDYYPYWHPSPWRDLMIMTNDESRCENYYKVESQNVKSRFECYIPETVLKFYATNRNMKVPNNKAECESFTFKARNKPEVRGEWREYSAHGIAPPKCVKSPWSRDNHLGNGIGGQHNSFNWTIPNLDDNCIMRIRYNISTNDFNSWEADSSNNNLKATNPNGIPINDVYGFDSPAAAQERGYTYENNPTVQIFPGVDFNLAINTAQFGRTFQDRSFVFNVKQRPDYLQGRTIHNVAVRGKRGNIVEVYPSVEYDFVPNTLIANKGHMVHFQWTGSNSNPGGNDGQGRAGSDRSNILVLAPEIYKERTSTQLYKGLNTVSDWGRNYPAMLTNTSFLGFTFEDKQTLAVHHGSGDMHTLDDSSPYFNLEPRTIEDSGIFHYFSTRNNAFTNRCQKARIIVPQ